MENTKICKRCGHVREQHEKIELAMRDPKGKPTAVYKCNVGSCDCVDYQ